jgi:CcmD family protein
MNWKKLLANFMFLLFSMGAFAQAQDVPMADGMRAEGKIYVVVAIILVILFGLIGYLVFLDRKLAHLEKRLPQ